MNIVFYLLIIIGIVFLWLLSSFLFNPIGNFFVRLWEDAKKAMDSKK